MKKQKAFRVISVCLGNKTRTPNQFSDRVIYAESLFEERVLDTVLAV